MVSATREIVVLGVAGLVVVVSSALSVAHLRSPGERAGTGLAVTTIVDGDTFDVVRDDATVRVRLLNVDTPATADPDREPECGGAEAAEWLAERLPIGSRVELAHDVERTDRDGLELAWVTAEDGGVVNLDIARAGLGVADAVEPNGIHYAQVQAAQEEARSAQSGLFDPAMRCTLSAQVAAQVTALQSATRAAATGDPAEAIRRLEAALEGTASVDTALARASSSVAGRMLGDAAVGDLRQRLEQARARATRELGRIRARESARVQRPSERRQDERRPRAEEAGTGQGQRRNAERVRTPATSSADAGDGPQQRRRVQPTERAPEERPDRPSPPRRERDTAPSPEPPRRTQPSPAPSRPSQPSPEPSRRSEPSSESPRRQQPSPDAPRRAQPPPEPDSGRDARGNPPG